MSHITPGHLKMKIVYSAVERCFQWRIASQWNELTASQLWCIPFLLFYCHVNDYGTVAVLVERSDVVGIQCLWYRKMTLQQAEQSTVMRNADDRAVSSFAEPDPKYALYRRYSFVMPIKLTLSYTGRHLYVENLRCLYCTIQTTNSKWASSCFHIRWLLLQHILLYSLSQLPFCYSILYAIIS